MFNQREKYTGSRSVYRNIIWNMSSAVIPAMVAFIVIPKIIQGLGADRFGLLTFSWTIIGYFNLFDLGISRALTKIVAEKLGKKQYSEVQPIISTAIILMMLLGLFVSVTCITFSSSIVCNIFNIKHELRAEATIVFYLLAASLPLSITTTGLRGILEAYQRFDLITFLSVPIGALTFVSPLFIFPFSKSIVPIVALLIVIKFISWCLYIYLCIRIQPELKKQIGIYPDTVKLLLKFGGWMTVTNFIGPVMVYFDRFLIGMIVSMSAVAYYVTPYEIVTKLWIVPTGLMGVFFPAFSNALALSDKEYAAYLFSQAVKIVFILLFPIVFIIITFSHEGIALWLGRDFADNSSKVLQLLAFGVFVNSHAQIPFGMLQSTGRPDITGKVHLIELPIYLIFLWLLLNKYGIIGAAVAWVIRVSIDAFLLFFLTYKFIYKSFLFFKYAMFTTAGVALSVMIAGIFIESFFVRIIFSLITITIFLVAVRLQFSLKNLKM